MSQEYEVDVEVRLEECSPRGCHFCRKAAEVGWDGLKSKLVSHAFEDSEEVFDVWICGYTGALGRRRCGMVDRYSVRRAVRHMLLLLSDPAPNVDYARVFEKIHPTENSSGVLKNAKR